MATSTPARNLTILLTDIKGFTDKTSRKSRHDIMAMLDKHKELVLPTLEGRGGRLIKTIGDAFLMVFDSPTDAVLAGVAVQEALRAYNADKAEDDRIEVRIAINSGEVSLTENDIFGEPVNITARIESVAEAGEVFFTEAVYLAMNKNEVPSAEVGLLQLKGIPEKIRVYKVRREHPVGALAGPAPLKSSKARLVEPARPDAAAAPAPRAGAPLKSRALALLLDLILCGTLAAVLTGDRDEAVRVRANPKGVVVERGGEPIVRIDGKNVKINDGEDVKVDITPMGIEVDDSSAPRKRGRDPFPLFWLLYSVLFLKLWGTTPGGRIMKLRVVGCDREDEPLQWKHVLTRSLLTLVSASAAGLGFLWALWDKDKKGWHDRLANTKVVERESC